MALPSLESTLQPNLTALEKMAHPGRQRHFPQKQELGNFLSKIEVVVNRDYHIAINSIKTNK